MGTDPEHAKAANELGPIEGPHGPVHLVCADFQGASRSAEKASGGAEDGPRTGWCNCVR